MLNIREPMGAKGLHSEETKYKLSLSKIGNKYCVGRIQSDETRKKIKETRLERKIPSSFKGKTHSIEARTLLSESRKKYSGANHPFYNRKHSEETLLKMSLIKKGKYSPNKGKRISKLQGSNNPNSILNEIEVLDMWRMINEGYSILFIKQYFNVSRGYVSKIKTGRAWNHITGLPKIN